jgi:hypothetical protein
MHKNQFISNASTNLCLCRGAGWIESGDLLDVRYYGMIKWDLGDKKLYLIPDLKDEKKRDSKIAFDWKENPSTQNSSPFSSILNAFVCTYGGPFRASQWKQCHVIFRSVWIAACKAWGGFPCTKGLLDFVRPPEGGEAECIALCSMHAVDELPPTLIERYSKTMEQMEIVERMDEWGKAKIRIEEHEKTETTDSEEAGGEVTLLDICSFLNDSYPKAPVRKGEARIPFLLSEKLKEWILSELKDNPLASSKANLPELCQPILDKMEVKWVKHGRTHVEEASIKNQ